MCFAVVQTHSAHSRAQLRYDYRGIHTRRTAGRDLNLQRQCSESRACNEPQECDLPYPGRHHSEEISILNMFEKLCIATF